MGDYAFRVMSSLMSSETMPASVRTKVMRAAGFDIAADACIWPGASFRSRKIKIGSGVFINVGFYFDGYDNLAIGNNVRVGAYVRVITATHEIGPPEQRGLKDVVGRPVTISDGCWIGTGVTILPGVTIDRGCVIGANSLVAHSTQSDGVYVGTPARRVKDLPTV